MPVGEPVFASLDVSPYTYHQWAAASGDISVRRPFLVWREEWEEQAQKLAEKLQKLIEIIADLPENVCQACYRYSASLDFYVRHLDQILTLSIRSEDPIIFNKYVIRDCNVCPESLYIAKMTLLCCDIITSPYACCSKQLHEKSPQLNSSVAIFICPSARR